MITILNYSKLLLLCGEKIIDRALEEICPLMSVGKNENGALMSLFEMRMFNVGLKPTLKREL